MTWICVGRAAPVGRGRDRWRRLYNQRFGVDRWRIVLAWGDGVLERSDAGRLFEECYQRFLHQNPRQLDWLCAVARDVYENAHSNVRSGRDYRVQERKREHVFDIALRSAVWRLGRSFQGQDLLAFCGPNHSEQPISPGVVRFLWPERIAFPAAIGWWQAESLECFWQSNRVLQRWEAIEGDS